MVEKNSLHISGTTVKYLMARRFSGLNNAY